MSCKIIKDKRSGEEFLIPGCFSVAHNWGSKGMTDREIIKTYCSCHRTKREKYETKTRDEVFGIISKIKEQILKAEGDLEKLKEDLYGLEAEVFMLNAEEVEIPD